MYIRKVIGMVLTLCILLTVFSACGGAAEKPNDTITAEEKTSEASTDKAATDTADTAKNVEILKCKYLVPGTEKKDSPAVDAAINEKLKKDNVNVEFTRAYIPWDVWQQKTNAMMATGEEFELIHIMEDWVPTASFVGKGALAPLNKLIENYGPVLKEIIPPEIWKVESLKGEIYSIPVMFRDFSFDHDVSIQKQYWDKYNLELPKTIDELIEQVELIYKGEKDPDLKIWVRKVAEPFNSFHRGYATYPFTIKNSMIYVDQQGNIKPWYETEEFKQDCLIMAKLYQKGLIPADVLTMPWEEVNTNKVSAGKWIAQFSGGALFEVSEVKKRKPDAQIVKVTLNPEKPIFRGDRVVMNSNGVSSTSKHPEAGVMFFNWLYSSQENYDLLNYGIENKHWRKLDGRKYEVIAADPLNPDYGFGDWEIGHYKLVRIEKNQPSELEPIMFTFDPKTINCISTGFTFNSEPVNAEYSAVLAEIEASIYPLKYGVVDFDKNYPKAIEALKKAGYDKVVEEYKKQFAAWLAENK